MSKLENIIQIALEGGRRSDIEWAVKLAYNKALDDAIVYLSQPEVTLSKDLESLKIK